MFRPIWSIIAQITDQRLRMALALLDTSTSVGSSIAGRLTEYFSDVGSGEGPVPLSVIRETGRSLQDDGEDGYNHPVCLGACSKLGVPVANYVWSTDSPDYISISDIIPVLPPELAERAHSLRIGDVIALNGTLLVIVENHIEMQRMDFAPLTRVDPTK